ncbi:amino acid adenylation domain-containing protein [Streptomyces sp. NPDC048639]|uniref:amino acid adenylation domain-containing protein n=1 Tax=Streptomyces sp. NPDC048639 TaxID=3365581 RepID=UPI00371E5701
MSDLVDAFMAAARNHPDSTAISHNGQALTYAGLVRRVRATAARLGPSPGVVGVLTDRSPATIVAMLGVLGAGGTYCPVDPTFPAARQQALLESVDCTTVLAAKPGAVAPPGIATIALPEPESSGTSDDATLPGPAQDDPAYTLFTSGSSGKPKPVVTPHRAIAAAVASLRGLFGLRSEDRVLQFASLNWDTSFEEILPALTAGATLVFHDEAYTGSLPRLLRAVAVERITLLDLPTAFWHELVHHLMEDGARLPDSVRTVVIGGEAVSPARLADWRVLGTGRIRLVNTYGCTETTLITHAVDLHGPGAPGPGVWWGENGRVPIGRPLPHVRDDLGKDGELLVSGPSLALGYRDLPEVTAEKFVVREGRDGPARWFRTGDRVSRRPDGHVVHEGRLDAEIKVRGIRVDPGEVEAHLTSHPGVAGAAVVGTRTAGSTTMAAYLVASHDAGGSLAQEVLAQLRRTVPGHLVPHRVTVVPELIYTASGKVDRAATHRLHHAPPASQNRTAHER